MKGADEVLLAVDVQYDFMPGGALAVARGDESCPSSTGWPASFRMSC